MILVREIAGKVGLHTVERVRPADSPRPGQLASVSRTRLKRPASRLVRRDDAGLVLGRYA